MGYIDFHCHFSGSLSNKFFHQISGDGKPPKLDKTNNWQLNYLKFFQNYRARQSLYRKGDISQYYFLGAEDIAESYYREGVKQFQLRIGLGKNIEDIKIRLLAMNKGFELVEKKYRAKNLAKIVLTFIKNESGEILNFEMSTLESVFGLMASNSALTSRVIGFDLCGPELGDDSKQLVEYLQTITNLRSWLVNKTNRKIEIMAHLGEYVLPNKYEEIYTKIEKCLDFELDRIGHGTILWLPPGLIDLENQQKVAKIQSELLKLMAKKGVMLEICPSSNLFMTPLKNTNQIPFDKFKKMNIKYSINTDNKEIIGTNLNREYEICSQWDI